MALTNFSLIWIRFFPLAFLPVLGHWSICVRPFGRVSWSNIESFLLVCHLFCALARLINRWQHEEKWNKTAEERVSLNNAPFRQVMPTRCLASKMLLIFERTFFTRHDLIFSQNRHRSISSDGVKEIRFSPPVDYRTSQCWLKPWSLPTVAHISAKDNEEEKNFVKVQKHHSLLPNDESVIEDSNADVAV